MENYDQFDNINGELKKLKSSSIYQIFGTTNLRWFEINFKSKTFSYKMNKYDKNFKTSHKFSEIVDFTNKLSDSLISKCDWKYGLNIKTFLRDYILFLPSIKERDKWIYGLNIILMRIPEAFPKIPESVFHSALNFLYYPYHREMNEVLSEKKKKSEDEEKQRKIMEEERLSKLKELRLKEEEEEKLRIQRKRQEEAKRVYEEQQKKLRKSKLYDDIHESIFMEASSKPEEVSLPIQKLKLAFPKFLKELELNKNKIKEKAKVFFNFEEKDIHDWNYYDEKKKIIKQEELIKFNPVLDNQNLKLGMAFHSVIKGYVDPNKGKSQLNLENMHIKTDKKNDEPIKKGISQKIFQSQNVDDIKQQPQLKSNENKFSVLKSIIALPNLDKEENFDELLNSKTTQVNNSHSINTDRSSSTVKKETLLKSLNRNSTNKDEKYKDLQVLNNTMKGSEINLTLYNVNKGNPESDKLGFYEKFISRKNTVYKKSPTKNNNLNDSNIGKCYIDKEDLVLEKCQIEEKQKKKKVFENIFFNNKKVEDFISDPTQETVTNNTKIIKNTEVYNINGIKKNQHSSDNVLHATIVKNVNNPEKIDHNNLINDDKDFDDFVNENYVKYTGNLKKKDLVNTNEKTKPQINNIDSKIDDFDYFTLENKIQNLNFSEKTKEKEKIYDNKEKLIH